MANLATFDVCDTRLIYNKESGYEYSLPQKVLTGFLSGKAFDRTEAYSEEESAKLRADINELYMRILSSMPHRDSVAVITAGAPGAGKTTLVNQIMEHSATYAYICPDDVCLKNQIRTYQADIESGMDPKAAYDIWRPGSNAATHLILANLIREKYGFYFGSTSSGPATGKFFDFLKKQGYKIELIHVSTPDDVRWASIQERDKTFVQTTEADVKEKGSLLPQRISDTFLAYADTIQFYGRNTLHTDAKLAATWARNTDGSGKLGTLHIIDADLYKTIKTIHNTAATALGKPELYWEATVETVSDEVK